MLPDPQATRAQFLVRTVRAYDVDVLLEQGTVVGR
jgi:hypothetical protein